MSLVNVVDLEATCWLGPPPPGQANEIIEIGVCVLDRPTLQPVEWRSIVVRPARSEISAFCTELTGHTAESVAAGVPFAQACEILKRDFDSGRRPWASWGDYDRKQLQHQCAEAGIPYPMCHVHTNAKKVFARVFGLKKKPGMANALAAAGLPLVGRHHSGVDDARNIASLVAVLMQRGAWPDAAASS